MAFFWREIENGDGAIVVEITSSEKMNIDKEAKQAMIEIQKEILAKYPHSTLLIDMAAFNLFSANISEVMRTNFVKELLELSIEFNLVIAHSGNTIVETIVSTLIRMSKNQYLQKVELVHNRDRAIEKAKKTANK